jgi:putative ABC transport system substrate-binding protein
MSLLARPESTHNNRSSPLSSAHLLPIYLVGLRRSLVSTEHDLDTVFATLHEVKASALVIGPDAFFISRSEQLGALTVRHAIPAITLYREFAAAGGLMSYGGSAKDADRRAGIYAGRVLKGERPAELAVQQTTKVELVINLKTAKALGIYVPPGLSARADELIE